LRLATVSQNCYNRRRKGGSSSFKGVYWDKEKNKWRANITHDKRRIHLGFFTTEEAAAHAYDVAAKELHKEFAVLNFPESTPV
jgi:hypothetical protein